METNGRLEHGNGVHRGGVQAVAVGSVSLRVPQEARGNIVLYGSVLASDGTTWYTVKKERVGRHQFVYRCNCPGSFLGGHLCKHLASFKLAEAQAAQRNGAAGIPAPVLAGNGR